MLHVFEHHDERVSVHTHSVEFNDVVMLQVGQQLCLPLEVLSCRQVGIFQCLTGKINSQIYTFRKDKR